MLGESNSNYDLSKNDSRIITMVKVVNDNDKMKCILIEFDKDLLIKYHV